MGSGWPKGLFGDWLKDIGSGVLIGDIWPKVLSIDWWKVMGPGFWNVAG